MARIARSGRRLVAAALFAFAAMRTGGEARGFGGGFHAGAVGPRVGAWGRPLGPVRPGVAPGGFARPGFVDRPPNAHRRGHRGDWSYAYGLGGFGLGLGRGGSFRAYGDPWYHDDDVYTPPVYVAPVEVPVETEIVTDDPAVAACTRRFKTYDPLTQTYVGRGSVRRHCP